MTLRDEDSYAVVRKFYAYGVNAGSDSPKRASQLEFLLSLLLSCLKAYFLVVCLVFGLPLLFAMLLTMLSRLR